MNRSPLSTRCFAGAGKSPITLKNGQYCWKGFELNATGARNAIEVRKAELARTLKDNRREVA
ncbi:hypothetical protein [Paraferrimonas haliotis]|uniref:Uncharacterized protein n=1 Tax=Paraferrimonas haliotis TaxID=2013866 RepID=A0AA37TPV8_9GAMM|nr:hypothetical protein [Paraferrimonas haliotis]GLS83250.1 hypothetical protein GCM10007894_12270 [Paraferrimonas haliotis]